MKILCVISTSANEPFASILDKGTLPSWGSRAQTLEVCTLESSVTGFVTSKIDTLREDLRYSAWRQARFGQILDLIFFSPAIFYIPRVYVKKKDDNITRLKCVMPEILALYRWKYLCALKYFVDSTECDYLYTVNSSCFVNEQVFLKYLSNLGSIQYAGSAIPDRKNGTHFASGANRLISREMAKFILKRRFFWPVYVLEDVGLGRMMKRFKVSLTVLPTKNLSTESEISSLSTKELSENFHFRLKSVSPDKSGKKIRNDVFLFEKLLEKISLS